LTPDQLKLVRRHADRLLRDAGAYGRFPTPVNAIIQAAELSVEREVSLDQRFLSRMYRTVSGPIMRAIDKVLGLFDSRDRTIYLDHSVHPQKKTFLKLHETGHGYLPHQRKTFAFIEESNATLDPDVREVFDREANVFASEVLFQLDKFTKDAADCEFGITTPVELSKRFGASCYAAIRRYVTTNRRACAVLVLNKLVYEVGSGYGTTLRRAFQSPSFTAQFGATDWPESYGPTDVLTTIIATSQGFSHPTGVLVRDLNDDTRRCVVESFNSSYQVFVFIYPESELKRSLLHVAV
jgi:Zn-dependent peptidase ImmA (M78 family)